jgi:outer membrane biosynthesis protein TonB
MFRRTFCFLSIVLLLLSMVHRLPAPIVEPEEKPTPTPAQAPVPSPAQAQAPAPAQKEELSKRKRSTTSKTALKQQAATKPETRAKPTSPPRLQGTGRLIISRAPNFGWNIAVHLQIDGRGVGNITQGSRYDGLVPTGHHVLTVSAVGTQPTSVDLDVQPGRTYGFSAAWSSGVVVLRPST